MATVAHSTKVVHYASYLINGEEVWGIARLVPGGYVFTPEGSHERRLVSYKYVELLLYGLVPLADQQWVIDQAQGGLVATCSRTVQEV